MRVSLMFLLKMKTHICQHLGNLALDLGKVRNKFQEKTSRIKKIVLIRIRKTRWIMIKKKVKRGKVTLIRLNI